VGVSVCIFMKIVIKTKNLRLNLSLRQWIEKKLVPLEKFSSVFQGEKYFDSFFGKGKPRVEMWVEIEKTTKHHKKGPFYRAEAQMRFPGKSLRAEAKNEDLRAAITIVKDELQRQIKKYKNKRKAEIERGARRFKKSTNLALSAQFKRKKGERIREEGI